MHRQKVRTLFQLPAALTCMVVPVLHNLSLPVLCVVCYTRYPWHPLPNHTQYEYRNTLPVESHEITGRLRTALLDSLRVRLHTWHHTIKNRRFMVKFYEI